MTKKHQRDQRLIFYLGIGKQQEVFDKVQEEMARRARIVHKGDGAIKASVSRYNGKYLLAIYLYAAIKVPFIGEEWKGAKVAKKPIKETIHAKGVDIAIYTEDF